MLSVDHIISYSISYHLPLLPLYHILIFRAHRTNDLTKKFEKVGPFECDELEKRYRVSAKCYLTKVPALYTMAKEKFNFLFLLLLLVSRQSKSQLLVINELVPKK